MTKTELAALRRSIRLGMRGWVSRLLEGHPDDALWEDHDIAPYEWSGPVMMRELRAAMAAFDRWLAHIEQIQEGEMTDDELRALEREAGFGHHLKHDAVLQLCGEYRVMRMDRHGLVLLLRDVIRQACQTAGGQIDSMALSAYADAIRFLASDGLLEIEKEIGRRVIAREVEQPDAEAK